MSADKHTYSEEPGYDVVSRAEHESLRARLAEADGERDASEIAVKTLTRERLGLRERLAESQARLRDLLEAARGVAGVSWCSEREALGIPNLALKNALDSLRAAIARAEKEPQP